MASFIVFHSAPTLILPGLKPALTLICLPLPASSTCVLQAARLAIVLEKGHREVQSPVSVLQINVIKTVHQVEMLSFEDYACLDVHT